MKKLLIFTLITFLSTGMFAQKSVNKLIDKMKKHDDAYAVTLPGWLIRTGINILDEDELRFENGFQELVQGIKKLRVLHIDSDPNITNKNMASYVKRIKEKDNYEDYAIVREDGNNVHVIVKEKKSRVKSLVLLAHSTDGFTILHLKTDIDLDQLKNANLSFNDIL